MEFVKMHGLGNDYLYINCIKNREPLFPEELAKRLSNRHFGVGADGIILVCNSKIADFKMRIFNSDGSEAEMCGNGIRGFAKYVYDYNLIDKNEFKIETLAGIRKVKLNTLNKSITENITVDMGEPILHPVKIPVLTREEPPIKDLKIVIKNKIFTITCVSMGNPHAIIRLHNLEDINVKEYGPLIENRSEFPKRTNVEFIEIKDRSRIKMKVWERGAGETLACGTGACASTVASVLNGYTERKVVVELLGGELEVEWNEEDSHVYMTGPATTVFRGRI
ncbi:MAG: diaminopimelate epimerase [Clostridia bacterium]|nr:diaminopimelate epimerase [Clostridia bacterium]